jgi:hypothetical protein
MKEGCRINEVGMALNIVSVVVLAVWRTCKKEREDNTRKGKHTKEKKKKRQKHTQKKSTSMFQLGTKNSQPSPMKGCFFFLCCFFCVWLCALKCVGDSPCRISVHSPFPPVSSCLLLLHGCTSLSPQAPRGGLQLPLAQGTLRRGGAKEEENKRITPHKSKRAKTGKKK